MLLLCVPMMGGCGNGTAAVTEPITAKVVDHTSIRCPRTDSKHRAVLKARVKAPLPDAADGVSRKALYAKIDELRVDADRKGHAGLIIADQLDRCIDGSGSNARAGG